MKKSGSGKNQPVLQQPVRDHHKAIADRLWKRTRKAVAAEADVIRSLGKTLAYNVYEWEHVYHFKAETINALPAMIARFGNLPANP
jgi:hypothetical protein